MGVEERSPSRARHDVTPTELFLRQQVVPRRVGRRGLRALRWAALACGLGSLVALGFWTAAAAGRAPELAVSRLRVVGNDRLSEEEILEALGLHPGTNILRLDLDALRGQLLRSPWIRDVQITRVLPATLTLRVVERVPVGIAVLPRLCLIDGEGTLLDEMGPRYADLPLPLIRGLDEPGRAELGGRILVALAEHENLRSVVSEIDVAGGSGSIEIRLRRPPATILVDEDDMVGRLTEMLPWIQDILRAFPSAQSVDLRFRGRVYLRLDTAGAEPAEPLVEPESFGGR